MPPPSRSPGRVLRSPEVRGANRAAVLQILWHNQHMSRADLARQSGLSETTISRIIGELIAEELVREDGEENSTGGRPGRRLQLEPSRVAVGAEIQNWETRVAVSTMRGQIVESRRFRTPSTVEETLQLIARAWGECRARLGPRLVAGLGVAARGIVDSDRGVLVLGSRADWANVPVGALLEKRLGEPVYLENNVRTAALAEYHYGSPEVCGARCFVLVKVDEGVGMGIVMEGRLHSGPHMSAGEFGQMVIAMTPGAERHDRPGCLERLASNPALCDRYAAAAGGERRAAASGDTTSRVLRIVQAALDGDQAARASMEEQARCLGIGISNVVWGLDADVVVIDGAVTAAWPLIERTLGNQLPPPDGPTGIRVLLRPSSLAGDASLIGAATLPFTGLFAASESRHATGATA